MGEWVVWYCIFSQDHMICWYAKSSFCVAHAVSIMWSCDLELTTYPCCGNICAPHNLCEYYINGYIHLTLTKLDITFYNSQQAWLFAHCLVCHNWNCLLTLAYLKILRNLFLLYTINMLNLHRGLPLCGCYVYLSHHTIYIQLHYILVCFLKTIHTVSA